MATKKQGIDYFPFDIGFFNDDKILFTGAKYGLKGECVAIRLLCKIYSEGYFYKFGPDECLLFAKQLGDGINHSFIRNVVNELLERSFFHKGIYKKYSTLTSHGIQKRFFEATTRRKKVMVYKEFLLFNISGHANVCVVPENDYIIDKNGNILPQRKVKESKAKEKKVISPFINSPRGECMPDVIDKDSRNDNGDYRRFCRWMKENTPILNLIPRQITPSEFEKLKEKYTTSQIVNILEELENYRGSRRKYTWLYRTVLTWGRRMYGNE